MTAHCSLGPCWGVKGWLQQAGTGGAHRGERAWAARQGGGQLPWGLPKRLGSCRDVWGVSP